MCMQFYLISWNIKTAAEKNVYMIIFKWRWKAIEKLFFFIIQYFSSWKLSINIFQLSQSFNIVNIGYTHMCAWKIFFLADGTFHLSSTKRASICRRPLVLLFAPLVALDRIKMLFCTNTHTQILDKGLIDFFPPYSSSLSSSFFSISSEREREMQIR